MSHDIGALRAVLAWIRAAFAESDKASARKAHAAGCQWVYDDGTTHPTEAAALAAVIPPEAP